MNKIISHEMSDHEDRGKKALRNHLAILNSLDLHEIQHRKIDEWYEAFSADPYRFFLRCNESRRDAIWQAMLQRGA